MLNVAGSNWRELSDADLRLLHTIGDLLSITVERARLFARSRQLGIAEERGRLAREIHDTLGQNLAAITLQLETADALFEAGAGADELSTVIRKTLDLSRGGLLEARRSILDLRAVPLEGRSVFEAVQALIDGFRERSALTVTYVPVGANYPIPTRVEVGVFRIAQEALANCEQHAEADNILVELAATTGALHLLVADDGHGFRPETVPAERYGLVGINERVRLLGGQLDLRSGVAGTRLQITIPLDNETTA